jgi:putative spermidine/putrescine transport system substrate-binding protein
MPIAKLTPFALLGALALCLHGGAVRAEETVSVVSDGGVYQDAEQKAFYEPTAKALGITIKVFGLASTPRIAALRSQVKTNTVAYDVIEYYSGVCEQLSREGLTEKLDYSVINADGIPKKLVAEKWIGITAYSSVIAYSTKAYGDHGPTTWAEFWDTKKFPGKRALSPTDATVEMALLADGVPPDKLYPMDLDRAFKKLAEIKPAIAAWWATGAQAMQLAKSQEAEALAMWNGRAEAAIKEGAPIKFGFNQGILGTDCLVVPKGAPHKALAMKIVASVVSPEIQANLPKYINYGPVNAKAFETGKISDEKAKELNTGPENMKAQIVQDLQWWVDHGAEVQQRFDKLLQ